MALFSEATLCVLDCFACFLRVFFHKAFGVIWRVFCVEQAAAVCCRVSLKIMIMYHGTYRLWTSDGSGRGAVKRPRLFSPTSVQF